MIELANQGEEAEKLSRTSESLDRVKEQNLGHRTGKSKGLQSTSKDELEANWLLQGLYSGFELCG